MTKGLEIGTGMNPTKIEGVEMLYTDKLKGKFAKKKLDAEKHFPFEDNTFDVVVANNILEHVSDFYFTVNEIHRVLKENGIFYCSMPHFASSDWHREPEHKRAGHSRMFASYNEKNIEKSMEGKTESKKFELVKFDYCINFGTIIKPLVNIIGFQRYEYFLARVLPFNIDMVFFKLKKTGEK